MQLELKPTFKRNSPLDAYAGNINSQYGEDGIIAHIMRVIQPAERYCVEFGAWDGKVLSNCHALLTMTGTTGKGWRGLMIEADATKFPKLVATYAPYPDVQTMNRLVDFDGPNSLDRLLYEAKAPKSLGLISIDIDGNDYHVWEALAGYTPELVVIEYNPTIPRDVFFIQDRSFDVNHGCSLLALISLARKKGYELVATTTVNAFFVRSDKYPLLGIKDNSIDALYTPVQDGRIFQGYDGSIHVVGIKSLFWKDGAPLSSEDFQVLPKELRVWEDAQRKSSN